MGVIDAYRQVTEEMPRCSSRSWLDGPDDPEGWEFFNSTMAYADGDPDIHILNNLNQVGAIEVNAFQSQADVVIQKSTREGFGLRSRRRSGRDDRSSAATSAASRFRSRTVGPAIWCRRPRSAPPLAADPARAGPRQAARARRQGAVRTHFLTPRLLRDWLRLFRDHR